MFLILLKLINRQLTIVLINFYNWYTKKGLLDTVVTSYGFLSHFFVLSDSENNNIGELIVSGMTLR